MTSRELCERLGVTRNTLRHWLSRGLPNTKEAGKYQFDPAGVLEWLKQQKLVEADRPAGVPSEWIVETLGEVADFFGVPRRTVEKWPTRGMPGTPGPSGSRRGRWDLVEIVRWRERDLRSRGHSVSERRAAASADIEELRAERMRLVVRQASANLIDRCEVETFFAELIIKFREQLLQLPGELQRHFPVEQRATVREETRRAIESLLNEFAEQEIDVSEFIVSDIAAASPSGQTLAAESADEPGPPAAADEAAAVDA